MMRIVRIVFGALLAVAILAVSAGVWLFVSNARQDLRVALVRDPSEPGVFIEVVSSTGGTLCIQSQIERVWTSGFSIAAGQSAIDDVAGECQFMASALPQTRRLDLRQTFDAGILARGVVCVQITYKHLGADGGSQIKIACES